LHELGHNFSLPHAPCGVEGNPDPQYPYANAALGAPGRYIWGYDKRRNVFIDPRPADQHDLMSYCDSSTFSDFNYRRIQSHLTPADGLSAAAGASIRSAAETTAVAAPQELLLITGRIIGDRAELGPVKAFTGTPRAVPSGTYVLRVETASGTVDHPFAPRTMDHSTAFLPFQLTIPNPGRIVSLQVRSADGKVLVQRRASAAVAAAAPDRAQAFAKAAVDASEANGVLRLRWDATAYPSLTVIHAGVGRTVLAQDLASGAADLPTASLAAGGTFELILSDGLNAVRVTAARGKPGSTR